MKAFIVYSDYTSIDEKTIIRLFGRLENGNSFASTHKFTPYFYVESRHIKKIKSLLSKFSTQTTNKKTFQGQKVTKISSDNQTNLNKLSSAIHKKNVPTYEADLRPQFRFMLDNNLLGTIDVEGDFTTSQKQDIDRHYINPIVKPISPADYEENLKLISLDIESDKSSDSLYCIGLYGKNYKKNFLISKTSEKIPHTITCKDEAELLEKFRSEIKAIDPDIITGWHVIDFDLAFLRSRFQKHKIPFDIGRTNENIRIKIESGFFRSSRADIPGRQILDGLNLIRDPFIRDSPTMRNAKFESFTLEDVSQELLNEGKTLKGKTRHLEIDSLYKSKKYKELVEYNLQDCKLAYDLITKTKIIDLAVERSTLTGMPLDKITASIASFDSLYIREANARGLVSPTTFYENTEERITGGYVMTSTPGIYHNLLVLDFKSLYPSVIKTFNIDPSSHLQKKEKNSIVSPNKTYFKNQDGILPQIIEKLHNAREKAKHDNRELSSYAIKIIMNSFFGVLASPNCRYFSLDMANAITHFGQFIIKLTAQEIEKLGHKVIYSDTDSVFVNAELSKTESIKLGKKVELHINSFYDNYIKENYSRKSYLELEFEKLYLAFMMPPTRGTRTGSKKRYAGLLEKNGKEKIEVVGLEAIRGDWTVAAQEFQIKLLDKIFHKQEFVKFIRQYVKNLETGKLDQKLVYRKSLRKPVESYVKTTPPHVKAARKLDKIDSRLIQYYVTTEGPEPIQKLKHKIDYKHYIDKQIAPIANALLFFFDKDFDEIISSSKQMKLF